MSNSYFLCTFIGTVELLTWKTADLGKLFLGIQLSSSSSSQDELAQTFFLVDIQLKFITQLSYVYKVIIALIKNQTDKIFLQYIGIAIKSALRNVNNINLRQMYRKEQRMNDRYDSQRKNKFIDYISKQIQGRTSKQKNSRLYSNNNKTGGSNLNSSEIYTQPQLASQQQINKPRRGASILRNNSKSKYAESMGKFRKEFIKDSYVNFQYQSQQRKTTKEEQAPSNQLNFDEQLGIQELHFQMVRLHQNIKKLQHDS